MSVPDLGGKLFSYKIKYNEKEGITSPDPVQFPVKEVAAKYNGNIAEVDWRSVENIGSNPSITPKRYGYVYDKLNRLTAGFYQTPNNPSVGENTESLTYDLNGNITKLFRTSVLEYGNTTPTKIDDLEYIYSSQNKSNKLMTINDSSSNPTGYEGGGMEIRYDVNGNMTEMPDKGIDKIYYNYLNLPNKISYSRGGTESAIINTKYGAGGEKLQKENNTTIYGFNGSTTTTKITDYLDGFQYLTTLTPPPPGGFESVMMANSETGRALERQAFSFDNSVSLSRPPLITKHPNLQFFPTAEGFYDYAKNEYIYQYKDHLGNVRISFGKDSAGNLELVDVNDYYPFGMNHLKSGNSFFGAGSYKNYKYQEQELQETGFYAFKWRQYMPDVARFFNIDPLAEKYTHNSTYAFSENRVIDARELEGLEAVKLNEGTKNLIIAVRGWQGGNPDPGKTQVKNIGKDNFASTLVNAYSSQKDTQIAVFDASFNSRTPNDISESIKAFRKLSPDGQLVLVGHSMGGDNIVNVANDNPDVKINKMVTLDISDYGANDNKIPSNTDVAINYYQTETPIGGTKLEPTSNNSTSKIVNVKTSNTTHTTIDNDYRVNILNEVRTAIPKKNK